MKVHAHRWEFQFARRIEVTVLSWRCVECSRTKLTQLLPRSELKSALSVSLKSFIELLDEGKRFDQRHPELGQVAWLHGNWSFDDGHAYFISTKVISRS